MRHQDAGDRDAPHQLERRQPFRAVEGDAFHLHQVVDGDGLGVLREVGELDEQLRPVAAALPHPDDAAAAHLDVRGPHVGEGVEAVPVGAGGDDLPVVLRGGIEVVVVVVEPGPRERLRLFPGQHPEGRAGLHPRSFTASTSSQTFRTCEWVGLRHAAPMQKRVDPPARALRAAAATWPTGSRPWASIPVS